ncbi:retrovirus-related pol polyprotein from transposon TNT 1-94 [Tanacetum coccineum]
MKMVSYPETNQDLSHKDTTNKKPTKRNRFDETYAPVARLESIRILLAYACAHDFKLFQMDVESAFLNSFINEEVFVAQPPSFVNFEKPNHVFKLKKALYGRKQAPQAWYDRLKAFLFDHKYTIGLEMLKKFGLEDSKHIKTPMSSKTKLAHDKDGESVDDTKYSGMIGSLLYLTASRPDIMFSVCLCAHFQEDPKTSHLEALKRIFKYIKGTTYLGLWYPKGTGVETIVYADFDHAGDYVDRKSTSGSKFLALGWHLEEIHVTLAHLEKKQTRLRTYTKSLEELCKQCVETASQA